MFMVLTLDVNIVDCDSFQFILTLKHFSTSNPQIPTDRRFFHTMKIRLNSHKTSFIECAGIPIGPKSDP